MTSRVQVKLMVNGQDYCREVEPRLSLIDFIRDEINLTGSHVGCEHGVCGACSVLLDDEPVRSCLMFAVQAHGSAVTTVEGLTAADGSLSVLQDAFWETHALQCGYCTPGMLIAASALLKSNPAASDEEIRDAIEGNLCRCTGYAQIIEAIKLAQTRNAERRPSDIR